MKKMQSLNFYIFLFLLASSSISNAQDDPIYGVWRITKCISDDYNEPIIAKEDQSREIGRRMIMTPERLIISFKNYNDTCLNPSIKITKKNIDHYFKNDKQMISWLGFNEKKEIEVIKTDCEAFWFKQFYRIETNTILLRAEGFFYYLKQEFSFKNINLLNFNFIEKEVAFKTNQTNFVNDAAVIDSLKIIANILKRDTSLTAIILGNTNNKKVRDLDASTTINGKEGTFKVLLLDRADAVAKLLINKLGVKPNQLITMVGQLGYKKSTTVMLLRNSSFGKRF